MICLLRSHPLIGETNVQVVGGSGSLFSVSHKNAKKEQQHLDKLGCTWLLVQPWSELELQAAALLLHEMKSPEIAAVDTNLWARTLILYLLNFRIGPASVQHCWWLSSLCTFGPVC